MTEVSAALVRFALSGEVAVPEALRAAVPGLPGEASGTGGGSGSGPDGGEDQGPGSGGREGEHGGGAGAATAAHEPHLAGLRSAYPPHDPRMAAFDAAACLTRTGTHPLVAATAAVAALRNADRAAEATVLGCEVACRLAALLGVRPEALAVVGAALAGSTGPEAGLRALGLAAAQATAAAGASGEQAEVASLRAALAAADGTEAAQLGERGFTAPPHPLEGRRGLLALLAPTTEIDELVRELGARWTADRVLTTTSGPAWHTQH